MPYYVYIILCDDGSFYTGYTKNVNSRMRLHMNGKGARYTKMHKPKKLVYTEEFDYRAEAMKRERKVKTMGHKKKMHLMQSQTKKTRRKSRRDKQQ